MTTSIDEPTAPAAQFVLPRLELPPNPFARPATPLDASRTPRTPSRFALARPFELRIPASGSTASLLPPVPVLRTAPVTPLLDAPVVATHPAAEGAARSFRVPRLTTGHRPTQPASVPAQAPVAATHPAAPTTHAAIDAAPATPTVSAPVFPAAHVVAPAPVTPAAPTQALATIPAGAPAEAQSFGAAAKEVAYKSASKLPQITALFWALKMAATTVGETGGDQISEAMHVGFLGTFFIFLVVFLIAVTTQVRTGKLIPALYWTVIIATSAMGTEMADFIFHTLGIGLVSVALGLVAPMVVIYLLGRFTGGSFSVTDIRSRRDEALYWALILTSNTIGTGVGDGLSITPLGVWGSTIMISAFMGVLYYLYRRTSVSRVGLFWAAFILTRPLGATGGDLLWKPHSLGGLGLGRIGVSLVLITIIVTLVMVQTKQLRERASHVEPEDDGLAPPAHGAPVLDVEPLAHSPYAPQPAAALPAPVAAHAHAHGHGHAHGHATQLPAQASVAFEPALA